MGDDGIKKEYEEEEENILIVKKRMEHSRMGPKSKTWFLHGKRDGPSHKKSTHLSHVFKPKTEENKTLDPKIFLLSKEISNEFETKISEINPSFTSEIKNRLDRIKIMSNKIKILNKYQENLPETESKITTKKIKENF